MSDLLDLVGELDTIAYLTYQRDLARNMAAKMWEELIEAEKIMAGYVDAPDMGYRL